MPSGPSHTAVPARNAGRISHHFQLRPGPAAPACRQRQAAQGSSASSGRKPTPLVTVPTPAANAPSASSFQSGPSSRCRSSAHSDSVVMPTSTMSICARLAISPNWMTTNSPSSA